MTRWKIRLARVARAQFEHMARLGQTIGEPVSQDVHARQTFQILRNAAQEDWPDLMWAGLFHDTIHEPWDPQTVPVDDRHEHYGAEVAKALGAPEHACV